jgi:hypothetical protein
MRWTKTLSNAKRKELADQVKFHRRMQVAFPNKTYTAFRNLAELGRQGTKLKKMILEMTAKKKRPLRVLDAGAGMLGVSGDLKKLFKDKIHITSVTLKHPNISVKTKRKMLNDTSANVDFVRQIGVFPERMKKSEEDIKKRLTKYHSRLIDRGRRYSALVDEVKIGLIENQSEKAKYDLVMDFSGAISYSDQEKRVLQLLNKNLSKGGVLVLGGVIGAPSSLITKEFEVIDSPALNGKTNNFWVLRKK